MKSPHHIMALVRAGKPKRHRSCQTPLDCGKLVDDFTPLAQTRIVAWRWDGQFYSKSVRSLGPNRDELALASPVLRILFDHSPNGYPNHRDLRSVLATLDKKFQLMECMHKDDNKTNESPFEVYNEAAKLWRMMTRHCLDLFKGKQMHTVADTDLREVIGLAKPEVVPLQATTANLRSAGHASAAATTSTTAATTTTTVGGGDVAAGDGRVADVAVAVAIDRNEHGFAKFDGGSDDGSDEGDDDDEDDDGYREYTCTCAECTTPVCISSDDDEMTGTEQWVQDPQQVVEWGAVNPESSSRRDEQSDIESESSRCAAEFAYPSAAKGGQRVETAAVPKPTKAPKAGKGSSGPKPKKRLAIKPGMTRLRIKAKTIRSAAAYVDEVHPQLSDELRGNHFIKVSRMGLKKGQYILGDRRQFVGGCSASKSPFYKEIMQLLLKELQDGTVTTKTGAKKFINDEVKTIKAAGGIVD